MEINGVAHIMLTTNDFPRARAFYGRLLHRRAHGLSD
jgi:catechol 2,3-dioxygenase-like lactoylglutathione lyase family enzyme